MSLLRLFWRSYDRVYRKAHSLRDFPVPEGTVARLGLTRYRGRTLTLSDGSVIRRGDRIGILHAHNEGIAALHCETGPPHHAALAFLESFKATLRVLAGQIASGSLADIHAFTATTIFFAAMARAGFDVLPLSPRLWGRVVGAYQRGLMGRHHPLGTGRPKRDRFAEARAVWISRDALLRRYGPEGARSEERETGA